METNTVIFDLGKVLVQYDWETYLASFQFDETTYEAIANAIFLNEDWEEGDKGAPADEWLQMFIENAPEYEGEIRKVYENLGDCVYPFNYTLDFVEYFEERGYRIFYLSNYSEGLYEKTKEKLSFIEAFDGGIFSYCEKSIKPDKTIYKLLLERYDIHPEETLFFDDRTDNVAVAKELGIQGIVFTPKVVNDYITLDKKEH